MHSVVMMVTQGHQIGKIRQSLVGPVHHVMDFGEDVVGASRETTSSITSLHLVTLGLTGVTPGAPFEHRVTEGIIERQCSVGFTTDAPNGLTTQETHPLDLRSTGTALQKGKVSMGDNEEVGSGCVATRCRRRFRIRLVRRPSRPSWATTCPTDIDECIGSALIKAGLAIGWEKACSSRDGGPYFSVCLLGQLGGYRTTGVVEAEIAAFVMALGLLVSRPLLGLDEVLYLTDRALFRLTQDAGFAFGFGDFDRRPHLVEAERSDAEALRQMR